MSTTNEAATFTIALPESLLTSLTETPDAFVREIRLAAAIALHRQGRVSQGKGAEIAGLSRIDFLDALHRANVPACQVTVNELMEEVDLAMEVEVRRATEARPAAFDPADAERFYDCLGAWRGPLATREVQQQALEFWRSSGAEGIRWLVRRLRDEHHVDALHGVASLLADLGEGILGPIFEELAARPSSDQALALLRAIGWLTESGRAPKPIAPQAELVLADLLQDDEADLREAAARALRLLSRQKAIRWLSHRLRDETDSEVRTAIEEELTRDRAEKV